MNKKIILPFVAILVLAVAMVGAASADDDEVTTVDTVEVRGTVINGTATDAVWNATTFAAFWYDLDEGTSTEELKINGTVNNADRTINKDDLTYTTHPEYQQYEINDTYNVVIEDTTGYYIEGWLAEKYVAVNGKADTLSKLLVEFDGDDKKALDTGEAWDLGSGFTLTAQQIDLEGDKVWFSLSKDGKELDSEVIDSSAGASDQKRTYVYTEDIASEDDVPVFHCYVDAVFRGTDSNIVQVTHVFLIDNEIMEIDTDDSYGIMEVTVASSKWVNLTNQDDSIELSSDTTEHIMGDMYFKTAKDENVLRFYPMVEYTIGEVPGKADDADEVDTPIDNVTDANATPTDVVSPTPDPSPTVSDDDTTTDADNATDAEPTATKKPGIPGFEAGFAIAGLLAVAYLVLRQRE